MTAEALVEINLLDNCEFDLLVFGFSDTMVVSEQAIEKFMRIYNETDFKWQRIGFYGWLDCK